MPELYSYTVERAIADVRQKFGDLAGVRFTDAVAITWINDAQRALGLSIGFKEVVITTNLLAGVANYDLATLLAARRVLTYSSVMVNGRKLQMMPHAQFLAQIQQWDTPVSTDANPVIGSEFDDKLNLWPTPTVSVPSGITIYGTGLPADVTAADDKLTVPDRLYSPLVDLVHSYALEFDEQLEASQAKVTQSETAVAREMGRSSRSPEDRYQTIDWSHEDEWF